MCCECGIGMQDLGSVRKQGVERFVADVASRQCAGILTRVAEAEAVQLVEPTRLCIERCGDRHRGHIAPAPPEGPRGAAFGHLESRDHRNSATGECRTEWGAANPPESGVSCRPTATQPRLPRIEGGGIDAQALQGRGDQSCGHHLAARHRAIGRREQSFAAAVRCGVVHLTTESEQVVGHAAPGTGDNDHGLPRCFARHTSRGVGNMFGGGDGIAAELDHQQVVRHV
jgi:hypothetical protein